MPIQFDRRPDLQSLARGRRALIKQLDPTAAIIDPETGRLLMLRGIFRQPRRRVGALGVARAFLSRTADLFGLATELEGLEPHEPEQLQARVRVRFRQVVSGVPVFNARFVVVVEDGGTVSMVCGRAVEVGRLGLRPRTTAGRAAEQLKQEIGVPPDRHIPVELVILDRQSLLGK